MSHLRRHTPILFAIAVLTAVAFGGVTSWQRASAEFEVPLIDTHNFSPTDFRDIWAFYRAERYASAGAFTGPDDTSGTVYEFPQAYAVGRADPAVVSQSTIYQLRDDVWEQIYPFPADENFSISSLNFPDLNTIVGQFDYGSGYAGLWVGGSDINGRPFISFTAGGDSASNAIPERAFSIGDSLVNKSAQLNGAPATGKIYAIDAVQSYRGPMFAGGKNGLFMYHTQYYCNNDPVRCPGIVQPDTWQTVSSANLPWTSQEDITDIAFTSQFVAFVTTTNFSAGNLIPYDHQCTGRTSHLYRVIGSPDALANWTRITPAAGVAGCFYRVAAATLPVQNSLGGPQHSKIWVASGNDTSTLPNESGIRIYNDVPPINSAGTQFVTSQPLFGISVTPAPLGDINLVGNSNFNSWSRNNPVLTDPTIEPDQWYGTDESRFGKNNPAGTCGVNTRDLMIAAGEFGGNDRAVKVQPGIYYTTNANCLLDTPVGTRPDLQKKDASASYFHRVPLTHIEGNKFRISGKYQVSFTDLSGTYPQGGVLVQCVGAGPPSSVDCSLSNFSQVRTRNQGNTGGWIQFSYDVTRHDQQLQAPLQGHSGSPRAAGSGQVIELRCYGTYGAAVTCDDLKVESINTPATTGSYGATLAATGNQGVIYVNQNALNDDTNAAFVLETTPTASTAPVTAVAALSPNLIYAVGEDSRFVQRNAGNITGYIWAGTGSPTIRDANGVPTQHKALGWISTNCANHKDAQEKTLCRRARSSFGVTLQNTRFSGRAWLGKNYEAGKPNDDKETINLGACIAPARHSSIPAGQPYAMASGATRSCNTATRTCTQDPNKACFRDFDCYGRCEFDRGTLCLYNADCQLGATPAAASNNLSGSRLTRPPSDSLRCANGSFANPAACAAGGWLSFTPSEIGTPPPAINAALPGRNYCIGGGACFNASTSQLRGVARFLTAGDIDDPNGDPDGNAAADRGWVSLRGPAAAAPSPLTLPVGGSLFACQQCTAFGNSVTCRFCMDASRQSCVPPIGACTNYCEGATPGSVDLNDTCTVDDQCPAGKACRPAGFCSEDPTTQCSNDGGCLNKGYCAIGATCLAIPPTTCTTYGVNLNTITGQFSGYAWSSDYGWLDFRSLSLGTRRFVQTKLGDVYSQQNVGNVDTLPAPGSTCNATYVISASGTINNFCSTFFVDPTINFQTVEPLADLIPFASDRNQFANALGRIDLVGLEKDVGAGKNKFGATLVDLPDSGDISSELGAFTAKILGGAVYVAGTPGTSADFTIDRDLRFDSGASFNFNGSGVIIVNGNLRINRDILYKSTNLDDLRKVANAVFIIKGNLIIDNSVTKLGGNFYVAGTVCTGQPETGSDPCAATLTISNSFPLEVRGIMIAKEFFLARRFAGTIENPLPSELFISDGRLQANPPPGLLDFAASLPNTINTGP